MVDRAPEWFSADALAECLLRGRHQRSPHNYYFAGHYSAFCDEFDYAEFTIQIAVAIEDLFDIINR